MILEAGLFKPVYWQPGHGDDVPLTWERRFPEEGSLVTVSLTDQALCLSISPPISIYAHHIGKRVAASVLFEIAAKYAEKVGGEVVQRGVVSGCKVMGQPGDVVLAHYPSDPLMFDHICPGFQAVILGESGGHSHGDEHDRGGYYEAAS
jgi:hypothetical protein